MQALPTPPSATTAVDALPPFSLLGVHVSFFPSFIASCGGEIALASLTTTEVCERFVKPMTLQQRCSMCDLMRNSGSSEVGTAKCFISHAWKYRFLDVVQSILDYFCACSSASCDAFVWFDLFSNCQHDTCAKPFEWWVGTFSNAIKIMGSVLMILSPWNSPIPLTRAWCVFELYACESSGSVFDIAMTRSERQHFLDDLNADPIAFYNMYAFIHLHAYERLFCDLSSTIRLSKVNCERSESFNPDDRLRIFECVRKTVGFAALDRTVFKVRLFTSFYCV
jgi:hypothetical protein